MSIDVSYQPIDIEIVQDVVFPVILGHADPQPLLNKCDNVGNATAIISRLHLARVALNKHLDYIDKHLGTCAPQEFLASQLVPGVLGVCGELWPHWHVEALTSIDLLPDDFPVLQHYEMPVTLFQPLLREFPFIEEGLRTIARSEQMGGLIRNDHVVVVRRAIISELQISGEEDDDDDWQRARKLLAEALAYAEHNDLAFTEAID